MTTFVVQTYQSLNVNYAQVTASLLLRLIDVQIAISQGASRDELVQNTDPATSFQAKPVDLWVNGLWFTSLALSLTTTLIAVLTKQWINEYMVLPSGTPRDRARIRHFRFIGLQQWHVPLIIGLLPVLMHTSLGVFFAGFTIFLCSLSGIMATALGCLTGVGALAYLISNILPLFYANCPYKTPLASYSFMMVSWVRHCAETWGACYGAPVRQITRTLKAAERAAVSQEADTLDALGISWLHDTSSNASVQSIAVQSLCSLPLQSIGIVAGPEGVTAPVSEPDAWRFIDFVDDVEDEERPAVIRAIRAHHRVDQSLDRLERMQRGALRFGKFNMLNKEENRYELLARASPEFAIEAVENNLLRPPPTKMPVFDVLFWGKVFEASLRNGSGFLDIGSIHTSSPPSPLWYQLLYCAVQYHDCSLFHCDIRAPELFSFSLGPEKLPLVVTRYDLEQNGTAATLTDALATNMRPSFARWVLQVAFPDVKPSPVNYTQNAPDDVVLILELLKTRSVQATSSVSDTLHDKNLFRKVLDTVTEYTFKKGASCQHPEIDNAAIFALHSVIESEHFGTGAVIVLAEEARVVNILFGTLNRRLELPTKPNDSDTSWLTPQLFQKTWKVATTSLESEALPERWEVVANIFTYVSHSKAHADATETIYAYLVRKDWLHDIGVRFTALRQSMTPELDRLPELWCLGYIYIAATYIEVLSTHTGLSAQTLGEAREYIAETAHLLTLSQILLLGDCATQNKLWELARMIRSECWSECVEHLSELVACKGIEDEFGLVRIFVKVDSRGNKPVHYRPLDHLPSFVAAFAADIARNNYTPPIHRDPGDRQVRFRVSRGPERQLTEFYDS